MPRTAPAGGDHVTREMVKKLTEKPAPRGYPGRALAFRLTPWAGLIPGWIKTLFLLKDCFEAGIKYLNPDRIETRSFGSGGVRIGSAAANTPTTSRPGVVRVPPRLLRFYALSDSTALWGDVRRERLFCPRFAARGMGYENVVRQFFCVHTDQGSQCIP
jgi:hypothetical protein